MKIVKILLIVLVVTLLSYFLLVYCEYNRFIKSNKDLLITLKKDNKENEIQYGIFYKAIRYDAKSSEIVNGKAIIREFKSLFLNEKVSDFLDEYETPISSDSFSISSIVEYNDYEDLYNEGNVYYRTTLPDTRFIVLKDDSRVPLKEALEKKMVTIDQLRKKGLKILEVIKENNIEEYSRLKYINLSTLNNMINNKETFIIVMVQTGCSHCKAYLPKIASIAQANDFDVYTLDIAKLTSNERSQLNKIIEFNGTPTTFFYSRGKLKDNTIDGNQSDSMIIKALVKEGYLK